MPTETLSAPTPRRWKRWLFCILVVLLALTLFAWWRLWQGGVSVGPANADLSKIESTDNFSSSASTTGGPNRHLAAREIVIICDEPHLLLTRVGPLLREDLAKLPFVDAVTYLPHGQHLPSGARLPDLLIRLKLPQIQEHSSVLERTLSASIVIDASTGLENSSHSYSDSLTPPIVSLNWTGRLDHKSKSLGDGVGAERYRLTAPHIAKQIAKHISDALEKLNQEHGAMPPLPPALFGAYRAPADDLSSLRQTASPPVVSGAGLLRHNESLWEFSDSREPLAILEEAHIALKSRGWRGNNIDRSDRPHLRMTKGSAILSLYAAPDERTNRNATSRPALRKYHIHYLDRFTRPEIDAALRPLLQNPDENLLITFHELFGPELLAKLVVQLEANPIASPEACILLARHYQRSDPAKSAGFLAKAHVLTFLSSDNSYFKGQIDEIAKALKLRTPFKADLTSKLLSEIQIPQITSSTPLKATAGLDQPVIGYMQDSKGQICLICARVTPALQGRQSLYELVQTIGSATTRSTSRIGGAKTPTGGWSATLFDGDQSCHIETNAQKRNDGRFDIIIKPLD